MKYCRPLTRIIILFAFLFFIIPRRAYAYLDPGTGSYILQIFIATLLGAGFGIKIFYKRVKTLFASFLSREGLDEEDDD